MDVVEQYAAGILSERSARRGNDYPQILFGNSLAGYLETKSGRRVTFMIVVGNIPIASASGVLEVTGEQAKMVATLYKDL